MTGVATCDSNMTTEENHRIYKEAMEFWRKYYEKRDKGEGEE